MSETIAEFIVRSRAAFEAERNAVTRRVFVMIGEPAYIPIADGGPCNPVAGENLTRVGAYAPYLTFADANRVPDSVSRVGLLAMSDAEYSL